jgi:brefeldin A-inhibited guanine nucleotide-exchange protein
MSASEGSTKEDQPEVIGLGISNGTPRLSTHDEATTPPEDIPLDTPGVGQNTIDATSPPPLPPKNDKPSLPQGRRMDSSSSIQRGPTPSESTSRRTSNPASASVSSLHSLTSSVQSPSRPTSTRPRAPPNHSRQSSTATNLSLSGHTTNGRSTPQLSAVLITPPLQVLVNSKEAKKSPSFLAAAQRALDLCQSGEGGNANAAYLHPREIFEPLRLAISNPQTTSVPILITSLDLLSKLISHSFFSEPDGPPKGLPPLPDLITHTITLSYSETSPPQVALQVVKALMAIVLSTDKGMLVHQSSLLKAVSTVYNVFLLSNDPANQVVAQGGLTQMVHHVFGRVVRVEPKSAGLGGRSQSGSVSVGENQARREERIKEEAEKAVNGKAESEEGTEGKDEKLTL